MLRKGVKWPSCHSRPAPPCGCVYRVQPLLARGKAPVAGMREWCCQVKAMGKETELQRPVSNSPFFAVVGCLFFWCSFFFWLFFFPVWKAELKYSQGRMKSNRNLFLSNPPLFFFFLIFPLQRNKSTLELWHGTDLKPRHVTAVGLPTRCQEDV